MHQFKWAASVVLASALAAGASAQEEGRQPGPPDEGGPSAELNAEVVEQFDANSDGELNGDELGRARRFLRALRGLVGDRPRAEGRGDRPRADRPDEGGPAGPPEEGVEGDRPRGDRPRGDRRFRRGDRPRGDGEGPPEERRRGPRDEQMRLFKEFDNDDNGELNPEEFAALMGVLNERRGPRGPGAGPGGPPEGPRFGPSGPPEGRPFGRRGPPDGDRGPGARGPDGPPPGIGDEDREGPPARRRRPFDGERGRRPPRPDGGDAPAWEGDQPVGEEPEADGDA